MSSINAMRGMLVAGAAFAAIVAVYFGQWSVVGILGIGIVAHGALTLHLRRSGVTTSAAADSPPPGTPL